MNVFNRFLCKVAQIFFHILSLYSSRLTNCIRNRNVPVLWDLFCRTAVLFSTHHAPLHLSFQPDLSKNVTKYSEAISETTNKQNFLIFAVDQIRRFRKFLVAYYQEKCINLIFSIVINTTILIYQLYNGGWQANTCFGPFMVAIIKLYIVE